MLHTGETIMIFAICQYIGNQIARHSPDATDDDKRYILYFYL